jgi:hypothetical protein
MPLLRMISLFSIFTSGPIIVVVEAVTDGGVWMIQRNRERIKRALFMSLLTAEARLS